MITLQKGGLYVCMIRPVVLQLPGVGWVWGGRGYFLIWPIRGHAAGQGMIFGFSVPKQGN